MKTAGIIAEYNPFHNGHLYHLRQAVKQAGADTVLVVMSGDFVQRGEPAVCTKYLRTRMALQAGADAVLELPAAAAAGSAELFAQKACEILVQTGVVDTVVCGCESPAPESFRRLAGFLLEEPEDYRRTLRTLMKSGIHYARARRMALEEYFPEEACLLDHPNNILAVEYQKALFRLSSDIPLTCIPRRGTGHTESAVLIRALLQKGNTEALTDVIPSFYLPWLEHPLFADDFSGHLLARIRSLTAEELTAFADVSDDLAQSIQRAWSPDLTVTAYTDALAVKNYTRTRISRALLHILLGIEKGEGDEPARQVRLLGFRRNSPLLHPLQKKTKIRIVTKTADADRQLLSRDILVSDLYRLVHYEKFGILLPDEYRAGPVILD